MKLKILNPELNYVVFTKRAKPISDYDVESTYEKVKNMKYIEISNKLLLDRFRLGFKNNEIEQFNLIVEDLDGEIYEDVISTNGHMYKAWDAVILNLSLELNMELI